MTIRRGSSGAEVITWQRFLVSQGYAVSTDGAFGLQTEDATKSWQRANMLTADGVVGPLTLARANLPAPSSPAPATSYGPPVAKVAAVRGIEKLSQSQLSELVAAANAIGIPVDWLAAVISFETGGTFSPSILNAAGSKAVGLIQFMPNTAQNILKTATPAEATRQAAAMTFGEQLRRMVVPYFASYRGRLRSLNDVYLAVFYPAFIGKEDADIVAFKDEAALQRAGAPASAKVNAAVYRQNAGFDKDGNGWITKSEITTTIRSVLAAARDRFVDLEEGAAIAFNAAKDAATSSAAPLVALGAGAVILYLMSRGGRRVA